VGLRQNRLAFIVNVSSSFRGWPRMLLRVCAAVPGLLLVALVVLPCGFVGTAEEFVFLLAGPVALLRDVELTREK